MTIAAEALQNHACRLAAAQLRRANGGISSLPEARRTAVEATVFEVAEAMAAGLLAQARDEPTLATALSEIYAGGVSSDPSP